MAHHLVAQQSHGAAIERLSAFGAERCDTRAQSRERIPLENPLTGLRLADGLAALDGQKLEGLHADPSAAAAVLVLLDDEPASAGGEHAL